VKHTAFCAVLCLGLLASCDKPDKPVMSEPPVVKPAEEAEATPVAEPGSQILNFADAANDFHHAAQQSTKRMLSLCSQMKADIDTFLRAPTDKAQVTAQASYIPCYQSWISSSLFFQQPFDLAEAESFNKLIDMLDTRPFLPGYIDGIPEYPFSGLIHEVDMEITLPNLRGQHRLMDEESASIGFPVIEFFLWKMPVESIWTTAQTNDDNEIVKRRKTYLNVVSELLMEQLSRAVLRWQPNSAYASLPERAQLSLVLKSLQRSALVELLNHGFDQPVINDPEWYHPALISGHGRDYPILRLTRIENLLDAPAFSEWLSKQVDMPVSTEEMDVALENSISAIKQLPENYPLQTSEENENWASARQEVAKLAVLFNQLSEYFQVSVVTE
jgi:hypothetical protein